MLHQWSSDTEFAFLVQSGQMTLRPGTKLTHGQMVALGVSTSLPMSIDSRCGPEGSRMRLDSPEAERSLAAASQALQRQNDLEAATACAGSPEARIARKLQAQIAAGTSGGTWERLRAQAREHTFQNARLDPVHGVAAKLEQQALPGMHAESGGIAKALARRVIEQLEDAEVRPGQDRRSSMDAALADIAKRLSKIESLLQAWLGETVHPERVEPSLAMTRQIRQQLRSLVAVA